MNALPPDFGPEAFAAATGVSHETLARLKTFVAVLADWNAKHNLVSRASLADVWRRHIWDSAQLLPLMPAGVRSLADLGSGAGFPGLVLAIFLQDRPKFHVTLFEATAKKCAFLMAAAEAARVSVDIRNIRIEDTPSEVFDAVTARACAPLIKLLDYAMRFQGPNTTNLFLKGQDVGAELTEAYNFWTMNVVQHRSQTAPGGTILEIRELARVRF